MAKRKKHSMMDVSSEQGNGVAGPLEPGQRWSGERKMEVVLRLLRGEPMEVLSRELGIEVYRLEEWKEKALFAVKAGLRARPGDPQQIELDQALKRIGELTMKIELLERRCQGARPFSRRGRSLEPGEIARDRPGLRGPPRLRGRRSGPVELLRPP